MKNLNVRLSEDLHARLKSAAAEDTRSLNGEIVKLLEYGLELRATYVRVVGHEPPP